MNFLSRRTIRKYKSEPIPQEKIDKIMEVALVAPSACNRRPYQYILVNDKALLESISKAKSAGAAMIKDAPLAVVVLGDKTISDIWDVDCSISSILMQQKAWELGIGSCWVQMMERFDAEGKPSEEVIKSLLNIPEQYGVLAVVAFGHPDETRPAYTTEDMDFKKIHMNTF